MCFYHTDEAGKRQNCPDFCLALNAALGLGLQAGRADEVDSKLMRIVIELHTYLANDCKGAWMLMLWARICCWKLV